MKGADGLLGPQACSYWENSSPTAAVALCASVPEGRASLAQRTHTHIQTHTEWEDGEGKKTE